MDHEPSKSGEWGSNPRSPASKAGGLAAFLPPETLTRSGPRGIRTLISGVRGRRPTFGPAAQSDPGWTRTIVAWMWARSLCRWTTGPISVAEVGIEPTNSHQALDLAALPICVLGHTLEHSPLTSYHSPSCGGRIRTGVERLMRPCWEPDSSPLRSDQGESRTPTPEGTDVLSAVCLPVPPLGQISPYGNRTHLSSVRGWCPLPIDQRAGKCVGQESNLHSFLRVGYSHLGSPMPSRRILSVARVGVEPTNDHQGLSLAALPVCVPCRRASPMGFEPMFSAVTGRRALQAAPRGPEQ